MYDPLGECIEITKENKKYPTFNHEAQPHIKYFSNQIEKENETYLEWKFSIFNKSWMALEGIKEYRIWKTRRQEFSLALEVIAQLRDEFRWGPNKIDYFIKYRF